MLVLHLQVKTLKVILAMRNVAIYRYILKDFNFKHGTLIRTGATCKKILL